MKKIGAVFLLFSPFLAHADPPVLGESLFVCRVPFTQSKNTLRLSEGILYANPNGEPSYELSTALSVGVTDRVLLSAMVPLKLEEQATSLSPARLEAIYLLYTNPDASFFFSGGGGINASIEDERDAALYLSANLSMRRYHINAALTGHQLIDAPSMDAAMGIFVPISRFALTAEGSVSFGEAVSETAALGAMAQLTKKLSLGSAFVAKMTEAGSSPGALFVVNWDQSFARK